MPEFKQIIPVNGPIVGEIRPPGSKSITNRALVIAALADGQTTLTGVLESQDTQVMLESLQRLGITVEHDAAKRTCRVDGRGGQIPAEQAELWLENSGTSIRFLTSMCALGQGKYLLDGVERMRQRPIADLVDSLNALGASVRCRDSDSGCPPVNVDGAAGRLAGGQTSIQGGISSQFLSSLLMALPAAGRETTLDVAGDLVSQPYIRMTLAMMKSFGVEVQYPDDLTSFRVPACSYRARQYDIEPDASAASYFMGAAAVTSGRVTISGLSNQALQGDVSFLPAPWNKWAVLFRGVKTA